MDNQYCILALLNQNTHGIANMKNFTLRSSKTNRVVGYADTQKEAEAFARGYLTGHDHMAIIEESFGKLIERDAPACPNEPEAPATSYGRDAIRNTVRACLLRKRDLEEVLYQVTRTHGYADKTKALATHFFSYESAA